jgi:predicted PurR-regulated permease PerM
VSRRVLAVTTMSGAGRVPALARTEYGVSMTSGSGGSALPRGLAILVGAAAAVIVIAGMRSANGILGPAFLALVLTIVAHPIRSWLDRYVPSWVASLVCIVAAYLIVVGMAFAVVLATAKFAMLLPSYQDDFGQQVSDLTSWLGDLGIDQAQIDQITSPVDLTKLGGLLESILGGALDALSNIAFILTLVLFMTMDGGSFPRQLAAVARVRPNLIEALSSFARGTRTYLVVSTIFGLIVAVIDTVALAAMGVPAPLVWGVLAFITNYIPNIGFVIGLIPPAILALLEGGPGLMIAVIAVYSVINVIIQTVIQPKFVGDAVGLSTTLTFVSLVFWAWVLGPVGALLAIPMSLLVKALFIDTDPGNRWVLPLLSNKDDDPPARPAPA